MSVMSAVAKLDDKLISIYFSSHLYRIQRRSTAPGRLRRRRLDTGAEVFTISSMLYFEFIFHFGVT